MLWTLSAATNVFLHNTSLEIGFQLFVKKLSTIILERTLEVRFMYMHGVPSFISMDSKIVLNVKIAVLRHSCILFLFQILF